MHVTDVALRRAADAIDSMNDAFAAVDHEWRVVTVNRKQESLFHRSRAEVIGRLFWDVFPETVGEVGFFSEVRRAASQRVVVEFEDYYGALDVWLQCRACPREGGLDIFLREVTVGRRADEERSADASARRGARYRRPRSSQSSEYDSSVFQGRARHGRSEPAPAHRDDRASLGADGDG